MVTPSPPWAAFADASPLFCLGTSFFCTAISQFTCSLLLKETIHVFCTISSAYCPSEFIIWNVREPCREQHDAGPPPPCLLLSNCPWHSHALGASIFLMPRTGRWDQPGEMLFSASYCNEETPTGNGRRVAQSCPSESRATLLISQHSRQAWRALHSLYAFPVSIVKNLLQDREARSLTSRGSIIHYLSSVSITPTCSSIHETKRNLQLLNLAFFLWWVKLSLALTTFFFL